MAGIEEEDAQVVVAASLVARSGDAVGASSEYGHQFMLATWEENPSWTSCRVPEPKLVKIPLTFDT